MASSINGNVKSYTAGADLGAYILVKKSGTSVVAVDTPATDAPVGITLNMALSGEPIAVRLLNGGGTALLYSVKALEALKPTNNDQKVGIEIIRRALQAPLRQIAENAGFDGAVVAGKLLESSDVSFGFDAQTGEYTDLIKAGIIDPTKVVRTALQDAASVAGLLITTEAMIAEKPKKDAPAMPDMGGMGGMGGMDF